MTDVHLTEPIHDDALALLQGAGLNVGKGWEMADPLPGLMAARAWLVRTARLDVAWLDAAPGLKTISKHGVGVDNIPVAEALARGIVVTNTPGANAGAVAEHTLMMMLALSRRVVAMDRSARTGFAGAGALVPQDLEGRRLLIAGFGAIGRRVAQLAKAFGMNVTVWHRRHTAEEIGFEVVRDLRAALPRADVLSLHLPLTPETRGLIGAAELALLPAGAIVLNTGRGGVVDENALTQAASRLGGIGLDVFEAEPPPSDHPLFGLENALFSPHAAALSPRAFRQMGMMAAQNLIDTLNGHPPRDRLVAQG
ncbi:hydroxyacid dehydrogenase [Rhodovulum sp. P5]|uniref:hydroxyacid dehydrogenase n=1 Tax=Rhodovulum sp. P5 TaxID=1564506 RepID=UPI0009DA4D9A|nr:hydroxyacid dehydrogenase [Rhodovulum sp. P5]